MCCWSLFLVDVYMLTCCDVLLCVACCLMFEKCRVLCNVRCVWCVVCCLLFLVVCGSLRKVCCVLFALMVVCCLVVVRFVLFVAGVECLLIGVGWPCCFFVLFGLCCKLCVVLCCVVRDLR